MLSMSVDGINFIGQFKSIEAIIDVIYNEHRLTSFFVGEFAQPTEDAYKTGHNFYTYMEMDHKIRVILRNCVYNRVPGVPMLFQEALVKEFDNLAHRWLMTYGYVGCKKQAIGSIKKYVLQEGKSSRFEEVNEDVKGG